MVCQLTLPGQGAAVALGQAVSEVPRAADHGGLWRAPAQQAFNREPTRTGGTWWVVSHGSYPTILDLLTR